MLIRLSFAQITLVVLFCSVINSSGGAGSNSLGMGQQFLKYRTKINLIPTGDVSFIIIYENTRKHFLLRDSLLRFNKPRRTAPRTERGKKKKQLNGSKRAQDVVSLTNYFPLNSNYATLPPNGRFRPRNDFHWLTPFHSVT
ncbi:hypothetical protein NPIL_216231 [Nephila pilipes]|uniref:Secreted protein n=1 Tax=Nephila pilipes TaxID=299642 RepID=A0A8X6NFM4_NEPPI|nr:hypothetical protein NPIL_216231 [Nephila pilipes]